MVYTRKCVYIRINIVNESRLVVALCEPTNSITLIRTYDIS